ncbi:unnamed protein product [Arabidopsis halleri]
MWDNLSRDTRDKSPQKNFFWVSLESSSPTSTNRRSAFRHRRIFFPILGSAPSLSWVIKIYGVGSERAPLKLSIEANRKRDADHRLSLMVKGLHPSQNPAGIKVMMPKIWKLEGRFSSRINEDGSVQLFFKHEHHMLTVLDNGPWTYKDWLVVVDKWTRRTHPDFLRIIRFWVKILNVPDHSKVYA